MPARFDILLCLAAVLSLLPWQLSAQATSAPGTVFLRFVNATGAGGSIRFALNGEDLDPDGYASGVRTGQIGIKEGAQVIECLHPAHGRLRLPLQLKAGESKVIVAHLETRPAAAGKPPKQELSLLTFDAVRDGEDSGVTLLWLGTAEELPLVLEEAPVAVKRLKPQRLPVRLSKGICADVMYAGAKLISLNFDEGGDQALVLFETPTGKLGAIQFRNTADRGRGA